jgi:hypothetical protein
MRIGLLVILLIGFGCTGPQASQTRDVAEFHGDICPCRLMPPEKERALQKRCPSASVGWGTAGEVLSGAATAVRVPNL